MARLKMNYLARFYRRLAVNHESGIDVRRTWQQEVQRAPVRFKREITGIKDYVMEGYSLDYAMRESRIFPNLDCELVKVGERGGRMQDVFNRLGEHYENLVKLRSNLMKAIAWPMFELAFAIFVIAALIIALGIVAQMTNSEPIDIFGLGFGTVGNLVFFFAVVVMFFGSIIAISYALLKGWFGPGPFQLALRLPLLGSIIECLSLGRMAWSLALAHGSGMDAIETMTLSIRTTNTDYYMRHMSDVMSSIRQGKEMNFALAQTGAWSNEFLDSLATGEIAGRITETMERQSEEYNRRLKAHFATLAFIGGIVVMLLVFVVVIALIFLLVNKLILNPYDDLMNDLMMLPALLNSIF